jgi:hypothetical protein
MKYKFKKAALVMLASTALLASGCKDDASIAKANLTKAADNFEIMRRVVFYNTWTDTIVQQVEGKCSIEYATRVSLICKTGEGKYKRSFISLSGQVTVFVEQMESVAVNVYHYRRTFKPQALIPDIDFRGSLDPALDALAPDSKD